MEPVSKLKLQALKFRLALGTEEIKMGCGRITITDNVRLNSIIGKTDKSVKTHLMTQMNMEIKHVEVFINQHKLYKR